MTKRLQLFADIAVVILFAVLTAFVLGISFLNSTNTPTGGDSASHLLYAWKYSEELLFSGNILPWMPEVFAGFPFLSYYFPTPFIVIALLSKMVAFAPAFKWGAFAAAIFLPGMVHVVSRRWFALPWAAAILGGFGAFAFLLHEQNSIWGGNLLSILSGEFAYSYGILFATLAIFAWSRAVDVRGGWVIAGLLEAATGFSHGFTLLVVGFSTMLLLAEGGNFWRISWMLIRGHLLAFCLLGGWLWPMLEMHGITIPNDASFPLSKWQDLFPLSLRPVFAAGLSALPLCLLNKKIRDSITKPQARVSRYMMGAAAISCLGYLAGDQLGLANIRFIPIAWLLASIFSGWLIGYIISALALTCSKKISIIGQSLFTMAVALLMLGWLAGAVHTVPDWTLWNHAGLESKPQWHNLTKLFPHLKGSLWSPRLAFEHDPANNDLGSTRTLEALPMFIGGRPVLEGLYMESALLGPAIYQLQSEISAHPSSPLVRFPSGTLDPKFAAEHLRFLHADTLLIRSTIAKKAIEESGEYEKIAESSPFAVYHLREFSSHLAEVVTMPIMVKPLKGWMEDSFAWFRTRSKFRGFLPVYGSEKKLTAASTATLVREKILKRNYLHFETDSIGKPHLIKMAWHPRWKLKSAGKLYLAGPGFMLVVPEERDIILEFGHSNVGIAGIASTFIALLVTFWLLTRKKNISESSPPNAVDGKIDRKYFIPTMLCWIIILLACLWFATQNPEVIYMKAHKIMQSGKNDQAATLFKRAYIKRSSSAKKEEALFWLAKSTQQAGHKEEALGRYLELIEKYHGYWVPESIYRSVVLMENQGDNAKKNLLISRLKEEYPKNIWTVKLDELK